MVTEKFSIAYLIVLTRLRGTNKKGILSNLVVAALPFSPQQCWRDDHTTRFGGVLGMAMAGKKQRLQDICTPEICTDCIFYEDMVV